ncbi:immunoglobulin-binding protein, putative [Ixodes scapularis]|uniref:Immunoglobulin-binding protein, putative n=1 Tax=Ixodes scapularis TaxID=6945 RepID=B7PXV3_IXOSC|nr:immunoglobulin-binding protein, putative [Ixodes scapularis]|eukprot:XP_002401891.1 immunoglobulin-binding protein, putative [Ixodes scapularis]
MAFALLFLTVCAALCAFMTPCLATVQEPTLTSCSDTQVLSVSDVTISNAKVGETLLFNYTGELTGNPLNSPVLIFTMTKKSDGSEIPCLLNVGSCTYRMCGGDTSIEQQIGAPWNNQCPITPLTYKSSVGIPIPEEASFILGDGNLHLMIEIEDGDTVEGCEEFDLTIETDSESFYHETE